MVNTEKQEKKELGFTITDQNIRHKDICRITGHKDYQKLKNNSLRIKQDEFFNENTNYYLTTCSDGILRYWDDKHLNTACELGNNVTQLEKSLNNRLDVYFTKNELENFKNQHKQHQFNLTKLEKQFEL